MPSPSSIRSTGNEPRGTVSSVASGIELLEAWRAGDKKAADRLLLEYYPLVRRILTTKVPEHLVDDLVQDVFTALHKGHQRILVGTRFRAYVVKITKNVICGYFRAQRKPLNQASVLESSVQQLGGGPVSAMIEQEDNRILLEALRSIPLKQQFLLELYYWERMTGGELAEIFDVPEATARSRIMRAKERLREQIEQIHRGGKEFAETATDLDAWAQRLREEMRAHVHRSPAAK